jgi:hypothetical protein
MIPPRLRILTLLLLLALPLCADSRESAFQARAMLGPGVWSRVLRIENDQSGRDSRYPAVFHGLVVAFRDILWLYTEFDGTQTLSQYAGRLAEDQADLGPLLRAVEPGLVRFEDVTEHPPFGVLARPPPYHCFLAAVSRWQQLQREPLPLERARLLAYYVEGQRQGHMVLEYWRAGRRYVFDPQHPLPERELPARLSEEPLKVARALVHPADRRRPVRASQLGLDGA